MAGSPTDRERFERKYRHNLEDIIRYGESVINKLADVSLEDFAPDDDLRDLVTYRVQCVSEAAKNLLTLDAEIVSRHPKIPWARVRGIGNRLRHEYGNVDAEVLWRAATGGDVRNLVAVAREELKRLER